MPEIVPSGAGLQPSMSDPEEQLKGELNRALEEAARSRRERDDLREELQQFVYTASHDLQEPLREIRVYSQLLARDCAGSPQAMEYTQFIEGGVNKMATLIRDLLRYSRAGDGTRASMINLHTPVLEAQVRLGEQIRESGAEIRLQAALPDVLADPGQVAQIFEQLLKNAIQYCKTAKPLIEIKADEEAGAAIISVRDNGPGIPSKYHSQVFLPFKRLHGREVSGTGLGLAIARKLVRANGGDISVESDGEHGSTFKFTLPI
jgi:signal transduction histidine kinase